MQRAIWGALAKPTNSLVSSIFLSYISRRSGLRLKENRSILTWRKVKRRSMSMDGACLPINFYCRNARLCLKKAALSRKSHLQADELQHLRTYETLVLSTIPAHPLYPERKGEKPIEELWIKVNQRESIAQKGTGGKLKHKSRQFNQIRRRGQKSQWSSSRIEESKNKTWSKLTVTLQNSNQQGSLSSDLWAVC